MPVELGSLPTEILIYILSHLSIVDVLCFSQTSRYHHELQALVISKLRIGVFPHRINSILSLLDGAAYTHSDAPVVWYEPDPTSSINVQIDGRKYRTWDTVVQKQNNIISKVVNMHGHHLRTLEIALWSLERHTANALTTCSRLRHLTIRLDHPFTRHKSVQPSVWKTAAPSTVWNAFWSPTGRTPPATPTRELGNPTETAFGLPTPPLSPVLDPVSNLQLFPYLKSLTLDRGGITDYQLSRLVLPCADTLKELRLRKCTQLSAEFWRWLAHSALAPRLRVLHFTQNLHEEIDGRILQYVQKFTGVKVCYGIFCAGVIELLTLK